MTNLEYIKNTLNNGTLLGFEYEGKDGNIDPYYEGKDSYLLFFDNKELVVYSLEDVFATRFIAGKTLKEVANKIIITES